MSIMPITRRQRPLLGLTLEQLAGAAPPPAADLDAGFTPPQPQKPGFFKPGGMGRSIAGALGDVLLQQAGMQPAYAPMQRERQQAEQQEVQWQRRRQAENEDWTQRQQWEQAHRQPTPWEDNAGNRWVTDPVTGENRMIFVDKAPKQIVQDGQVITVQNPYLGGAAVAPQITEDLWNRGVPVGGPAATPGGFPRR